MSNEEFDKEFDKTFAEFMEKIFVIEQAEEIARGDDE